MLECAVRRTAMTCLRSLPCRQIPERRRQMAGGLSLRHLISVADRCVSPAHGEGGAANGEAHSSKTPPRRRANGWRSCATWLLARPRSARTCDRRRRLLVGLFKYHRLGRRSGPLDLPEINKADPKTRWLLLISARDAVTPPLLLFLPSEELHPSPERVISGHCWTCI